MILNPQDNYLFDTTFFSDLLDDLDFGLSDTALTTLSGGLSGYSQITLAEICTKQVTEIQTAFREQLLASFISNPLTDDIARQAGEWRRAFIQQHKNKQLGRRNDVPGLSDCFITATALANQLTLYTRDERHGPLFRAAGVPFTTCALDSYGP